MRYLHAEGASKMDEPQAGAFIMSCLERPVVRLPDVAVCFLVAMDEVALFVSGGLGGWGIVEALSERRFPGGSATRHYVCLLDRRFEFAAGYRAF